jgi:hypothetical protein
MDFLLNAFGFVVLIGVFVIFRQVLLNRRRRVVERFHSRVQAAQSGQIRCAACGNLVRAGAYCSVCGSALPPPLSTGGSARGRGLMVVVFIVLALIGLMAFFTASRPVRHSDQPYHSSQWQ